MIDRSYLEIGRGIARAITFQTTLTRRLDLSPRVVHGSFSPLVEWDGVDLTVAAIRYGVNFAEAYKIGDGEAYVQSVILEVALHPSNPLGINQALVTLPVNGGTDQRLRTDAMIVGGSPNELAYHWFKARHAELFGSSEPPVVVPPPPPPPPVDDEPPPVVVPPVPGLSTADTRAEELSAILGPLYGSIQEHSVFTRRLPTWSKLWPTAKPVLVELVLAARRYAVRAKGGQ